MEALSRDTRLATRHQRNRQRQQIHIDATKKILGEGFKRPWPPLIKMEESVKAKIEMLVNLSKLNVQRRPRGGRRLLP